MNVFYFFYFSIFFIIIIISNVSAQVLPDTIISRELDPVTIVGYKPAITPISPLPDVHQTYLMAGKKSEVINIKNLPANLAEKNGRQIFAKIPGAFVYDMDGSGNQINIATRGLDPHRSWEYNVRQNDVMINSDIYGYPAAHYSMPMEAIERVELVRGSASLQYGAEFGGMINYITKRPDTSKVFNFEGLNSVGSFGLFSSYNAIHGKMGKLTYYAYYQKRVSEGYRENSSSNANAQMVSLQYNFSPLMALKAELGHSAYIYQLPGPLTDSMFLADPRQSTRSRNYYSPDIYVPSLTFDWNLSENTKLNWISSAVLGLRNSVLFDNFANVPDFINPVTNHYQPRIVDIDQFNSYTSELRVLHHFNIGTLKNVITGGIRYINNDMHRRQRGKGTTGTDFDLTITDPQFGRDMNFRTDNTAFFVENLLYVTPQLKFSPGMRYEYGTTNMTGYISYLYERDVPNSIKHNFPLFGINFEYDFTPTNRFYGGFSQAYRPVLFKDIIPGSVLERANKNLENALGYNAELGVSGQWGNKLHYDFNLFQLEYKNRLGNLLLSENGVDYIYKTNIGDSRNRGIEALVEAIIFQNKNTLINMFTSSSYIDARYVDATIFVGGENQNISGNFVESAPKWMSRNGLEFSFKFVTAVLQYSYVGETFSDPINTVIPSTNGAVGIVPSYGLWDLNTAFNFNNKFIFRAGVNNMMNKQYFTKRPLFYPGPGIWSSDGRSFVFSLGFKI